MKDILAHLDAWHEMLLLWEGEGAAGREPEMPAPGFTWKDTPALNGEKGVIALDLAVRNTGQSHFRRSQGRNTGTVYARIRCRFRPDPVIPALVKPR